MLLNKLDNGASGQVLLAKHRLNQVRYAIKRLSIMQATAMNGNDEPYAEVQILWHCKETNCPNTLPIIETYW